MKTLSATIILCTIAIIAAILAPTAISNPNTDQLIANLQVDIKALQAHAACYSMAAPVTEYTESAQPYLGATRRIGQKFLWVSVVKPTCMPMITYKGLGWHY